MSTNGNVVKALSPANLNDGIVALPKPGTMRYVGAGQWLARFASQADDAPLWHHAHSYDAYTEAFWPTEPFLASAIGTVAAQYSARTWFVDGPPRIVKATLDMLSSADNGAGMVALFLKLIVDLKTRNNGAFLGIVREGFDYAQISSVSAIERHKPAERALVDAQRGALGRVITLQHLDSQACYRTGNPLYPVVYRDPLTGKSLWLPWHIVVPMSELPFPNVRYGGVQLSAVARVLRAAQIMAAHEVYKLEKITGRSPDELVLLNGINRVEAEDQLNYDSEKADNQGLLRWQDKAVLFGVSPDKPASGQVLSTKTDGGFSDIEKEMQWYITLISMGLLETYQTFAPLQAGGLGNSQQSIMLFESAQGKGPALWEKSWTQLVHQYAIIPRNCTWRWGEKSIRYEQDLANLQSTQLDNMAKLQTLGIPNTLIYQIMADRDIILTDEYLAILGQQDSTDDITVADDDQEPQQSDLEVVELNPRDVEPVDTLKALSVLRKAYKASEAEGIIAEFSEAIHGAVSEYMDAGASKRAAQSAFIRAIESAWPAMAEVGYTAGGGDWQEADEDDTIADETADQTGYALGYWDSLPDIRKDEGVPDARTELYVQSLRAVYNKYKLLGAGNKQVTWEYGDTDHCATCEGLNGQRHGAKWFIKRGYIPRESGSVTLDCKGFNCQCRLVDDNGEDFSI